MTPRPPTLKSGSQVKSSPESTLTDVAAMRSEPSCRSPVASLQAMTPGIPHSSVSKLNESRCPVRPGTW